MAKRRYKSAPKKRISKFTVFGVVVLCIVLCGTLTYKKTVLNAQRKEYSRQIAELKKEKAEADARKEELKDFEKYTNSDEYIEEVAREKLGLVYKDEIIFEPDSK